MDVDTFMPPDGSAATVSSSAVPSALKTGQTLMQMTITGFAVAIGTAKFGIVTGLILGAVAYLITLWVFPFMGGGNAN